MSSGHDRLIEDIHRARAEFETRLDEVDEAKQRYHGAIQRLHEAGMPLREIAEAVGLSHQRVHQIVGESSKRRAARKIAKAAPRGVGIALVAAIAASLVASAVNPQARAEAEASLAPAVRFLQANLPADARDVLLPKLEEMLDESHR